MGLEAVAVAPRMTHLERLEAESIHIIREVAAECEKPVMLYSIGKDSAVMLHLAMKAFYPAKPPFPLMHVDTTWKFRDMIKFRDETVRKLGLDLIERRSLAGFDSCTAEHLGAATHQQHRTLHAGIGGIYIAHNCGRFSRNRCRNRAKRLPLHQRHSAVPFGACICCLLQIHRDGAACSLKPVSNLRSMRR